MNNIWAVASVVIKELYRRKDFYVLLIITALITLLLGSINIFNDNNIVRYLKEICLLLIWISSLIMAITTAARQIPAERESRTIFPLLAKPVTRLEVILGKFLGCWVASGAALIIFYLLFGLITASREHELAFVNYLQAAWLHWCLLGVVIALTLCGSVVLTTPSANVTICFIAAMGILLLGRHLNKVALRLEEPGRTLLQTIYYSIPHLEFFDVRDLIIHNWPPVAWGAVILATLYAAAYAGFFLIVGWAVFRRKALN